MRTRRFKFGISGGKPPFLTCSILGKLEYIELDIALTSHRILHKLVNVAMQFRQRLLVDVHHVTRFVVIR